MGLFDFVGDLLDFDSARSTNSSNRRAQAEANRLNIELQQQANAANWDMHTQDLRAQWDAANYGVSWRVADAIRAGLHPLAALGVQPASVSPSGAFMQAATVQPYVKQPYSLRGMGQDISRALLSPLTKEERHESKMMAAFNQEREIMLGSEQLQQEAARTRGLNLDNEIKASQLKRLSGDQLGPPGVAPGARTVGARPGDVIPQAAQPVVGSKGDPSREAGSITSWSYSRTPTGGLEIVPSNDVKNRIEDSPMELVWMLKNGIVNNLGMVPPPSAKEFPLPKGYTRWKWNMLMQEYQPAR